MDEKTWLTCTDPYEMLEWMPHASTVKHWQRTSDRMTHYKQRFVRLLLCATARRLGGTSNHPDVKAVIEACEQVADGQLSAWGTGDKALKAARKSIDSVWGWVWACTQEKPAYGLRDTLIQSRGNAGNFYRQEEMADLIREIIGNPFRAVTLPDACRTRDVLSLAQAAYDERPGRECGNCDGYGWIPEPKYGARMDCPDCNNTGTIHDGTLDPVRLAVLADALEEAGCVDEALLRHLRDWSPCRSCGGTGKVRVPGGHGDYDDVLCRDCNPDKSSRARGHRGPDCGWENSAVPHVRGCWALDLVRGVGEQVFSVQK